MGANESGLVEAALTGDRRALDELLARHRGQVLSMLRSLLGNSHDADDACQETLLAAATALPNLRDTTRFSSWLLGIAYRKGKDLQRRRAREFGALAETPTPPMKIADTDRTELNLTISEVISKLPEEQRTILNLRFHGGLRYAEIAEALGVPVSTVRGALYRGMQRLRKALRRSFEETGS